MRFAIACTLACAGGSKGQDGSYGVFEEGVGDDTDGTSLEGDDDPVGDDAADDAPPDLGACEGDDDCLAEPGTCWRNGACVDGQCQLEPSAAGEPCDDDDPCSDPDLCDGQGNCVGDSIPCTAPNAAGGMCIDGACQGLACDPGFGNCNDEWEDGCEVPLVTETNCGECGMPCTAGANATANCGSGTCEQSCDAPWVDCDGDMANGCEVPEGVPNQCDAGGLNANGCWTAWCGQSNIEGAVNFDSWYCMECSTCHSPVNGQCQWCSHTTGTWFTAEVCECGAWEDLTCG